MSVMNDLRGHNTKVKLSERVRDARCQVAATACIKGFQALRVEARAPSYGVTRDGVVAIRIGHVILYLEDREAMESLALAVRRAVEIQDTAFGPDLPPPMFAPGRQRAAKAS